MNQYCSGVFQICREACGWLPRFHSVVYYLLFGFLFSIFFWVIYDSQIWRGIDWYCILYDSSYLQPNSQGFPKPSIFTAYFLCLCSNSVAQHVLLFKCTLRWLIFFVLVFFLQVWALESTLYIVILILLPKKNQILAELSHYSPGPTSCKYVLLHLTRARPINSRHFDQLFVKNGFRLHHLFPLVS